ncbi:hypothetical protein C8R43DRAFT_1101299 [Mycena crocata]|nr:hypothetical protein C8R43DRAFT_1101299 [Mycena crocata]
MSPAAVPKGIQGACDICRRQKVRCDSATMPGNRCSKCIAFDSECTHNFSQIRPHGAKSTRRKRNIHTSTPQDREATKRLVNGLLLGRYQAPQDHETLLELLLQVSRYARNLEQELAIQQSRAHPAQTSPSSSPNGPNGQEVNANTTRRTSTDIQVLPEQLKELRVDAENRRSREEGGSLIFAGAAIEALQPTTVITQASRSKREQFWAPLPWEIAASVEPHVVQIFPEDDLLHDLVEIYFTQPNIYSFILHRPSFERDLANKLHLRDRRFGDVVLAVCALASKSSPDERVLLPGQGGLSAGWKWFAQIQPPFSNMRGMATLYELQLCCLYVAIQKIGSKAETVWVLCGVGLLHARAIGAHKHAHQADVVWTVEAELSTRLCHNLSIFDAILSAWFGRARAVAPIEQELALPAIVDDEYWENPDPERAFTQPPGKPSLAAFNVAYIKLMNIYTHLGPQTVAQIDAQLDQWATEIPEHLLWNPYMEDDVFFAQSSCLYASYYHVQILLHRPLLQATINHAPSPAVRFYCSTHNSRIKYTYQAFRSLAICANAARSTAHVVDVGSRRGLLPHMHLVKATFDAAVVLVLNIFGGALSGLSIDAGRELVAVHKCTTLLRASEDRDILSELMRAGNLPESLPSDVPGYGRNGLDERTDHLFTLHMAGEDLGRMRIYDSLTPTDPLAALPGLDNTLAESGDPLSAPAKGDSALPHFGNMADPLFANFNDAQMSDYMAEWIPYWSGASTLVQAMQNPSTQ